MQLTLRAKWEAISYVKNFTYTGNVQTFTAPYTGYYKLEVWGAEGKSSTYAAGKGGYSYGNVQLSSNKTIYIGIGGTAGYNGGGSASYNGGNGGGATHISFRTGLLSSLSSYKADILIVAGGGGGGGYFRGGWGHGGGMIGARANNASGGTQTTGGTTSGSGIGINGSSGSFGAGGYGGYESGSGSGGGGGGWYGGAGGSQRDSSGGGGSGYIGNSLLLSDKGMYMYNEYRDDYESACASSTDMNTRTICTTSTGSHISNAANTGDGHARITYLGSSI